ncbi:MAG: hypothetical protein AAGC53_18735 [Actinomycetota bacterium]
MDRHMLNQLESRYGYDPSIHESTLLRNRRQAELMPTPHWPATGTAMISARLAEARRLRDLALVDAFTEGGAAPRTASPGDNATVVAPLWRRTIDERRADVIAADVG